MNTLDKRTRTMRRAGAANIALGTITLITGITVGVLSIINGAALLSKANKE